MPDYKTNDPKGWCGDPTRGAALGRPSVHDEDLDSSAQIKLYLRRVRLDRGGYDSNGTYFGIGEPLYWYADAEQMVDDVLRAVDRRHAKERIRKIFPKAQFFS